MSWLLSGSHWEGENEEKAFPVLGDKGTVTVSGCGVLELWLIQIEMCLKCKIWPGLLKLGTKKRV